jgi:pimeloyl-ACP methyl ester carboxylesterase
MKKLPLLLLPGTLCNAMLFEHQVKNLADVSYPKVVDVHLQDNLQDVARYVLEQVEGQFSVAGLSYGGIVAFEILRQAPERVMKIAFLNTNPNPSAEQTRVSQQRFVRMAHLGEFREITTDFLKDVMLHPDHQTDITLRDKILNMAESIGIDGFVNEIKAQLARPDAMLDLPTIICPTLVLTGREDYVVPLETHQIMVDTLPNSQLVVVEHCGHLSTMEQPEIVTDALRQWLTNDDI